MTGRAVVLTGPPSSGKTALVNRLAAAGHAVVPEAARLVIDEWVSRGYDQEQFRGTKGFQRAVERVDMDMEGRFLPPGDGDVFLDRAMADNIAFRRQIGHDVPDSVAEWARDRYDIAYVLVPVADSNDDTREHTPDGGLRQELSSAYAGLGVTVKVLPADSVTDRLAEVRGQPSMHIPEP